MVAFNEEGSASRRRKEFARGLVQELTEIVTSMPGYADEILERARDTGREITVAALQNAVKNSRPSLKVLPTEESRALYVKGQLDAVAEVAIALAATITSDARGGKEQDPMLLVDANDDEVVAKINALYQPRYVEIVDFIMSKAAEVDVELLKLFPPKG